MNEKQYYNSIEELINKITSNEKQIIKFLCLYETKITVEDEIKRVLSTLYGLKQELENKKFTQDNVASVFFPLNLPFYSLVLFAIAPVYFCKKIYIRCNSFMLNILDGLSYLLDLKKLFPQLQFTNCSRTEFVYKYVKKYSNIVLFTGKYENAINVLEVCNNKLFILNGSGINPVIVFEDADIDLAIEKSYKMRLFNGGQDCAGPDAFIVHKSVSEEFINGIISKIKNTVCGEYGSNDTLEVGPLLKDGYVKVVENFLTDNADSVKVKGKIENNIVHPSVICRKISEHTGRFEEFFAPIFYILTYETEDQIIDILNNNRDNSMYLTYFSQKDRFQEVDFATKIKNSIIDEIEQGNKPYGGYGKKANFVSKNGQIESRPILISSEISEFLNEK